MLQGLTADGVEQLSNDPEGNTAPSQEVEVQDSNNCEPIKKKSTKRKNTAMPNHISTAIEKLEDLKKTSDQKDEFDYFGLNIAHQLRTLSLERALKCQSQIQDLLMHERVDYEREKNSSSRFSNSSLSYISSISPVQSPTYEKPTNAIKDLGLIQSDANLIQDDEHCYKNVDEPGSSNNCDILTQAIGSILSEPYF